MSTELPKAANMEQNGDIVIEIDITPGSESSNYQDIRNCCTEDSFNNNENIQNISFLCDGGYGSSWVAGMQTKINMSGKYLKNNDFCKYLLSIEPEIGAKRVTNCRISKFGQSIECGCTLENIVIGGGTATDGAPITFTIAFNGKPTISSST